MEAPPRSTSIVPRRTKDNRMQSKHLPPQIVPGWVNPAFYPAGTGICTSLSLTPFDAH